MGNQTRECKAEYQRKWREKNYAHWADYMKKWRKRNPDKCAKYIIRSDRRRIEREFGLSPKNFDELIKVQHGKCAICEKQMKRPCVDHDHKTKEVRGLLCLRCNSGIGQFDDSIQLVEKALTYLRKYVT